MTIRQVRVRIIVRPIIALIKECILKISIFALGLTMLPVSAFAIEKCDMGQRYTCVVDGDTIWFEGEKIRMMGYDTPEPQTNVCGGSREIELANQASDRLVQLLNQGGISIERHGKDRYDRTLAVVSVGGQNVGDLLVGEGLARYWPDGPEFWCN
tara:strand:- start:9136 stop:9600 length:465 start_codon:yes stop_codon:yes gene_type:complete